jgi:hypothetical protein
MKPFWHWLLLPILVGIILPYLLHKMGLYSTKTLWKDIILNSWRNVQAKGGGKKTDLQKNLRKRVGEACDGREKRKPPLPRKWIAFLPYFPFFLSLSFWNKP